MITRKLTLISNELDLVSKYCIVDRPGKICLTTTGFEPTHTTFGHQPNSEPTELRGQVGSNTDVIFRNRV